MDMYNCLDCEAMGYGWIVWQNPIHPQMVGRLLALPLIDISDATYWPMSAILVEEELHLASGKLP